MNPTLNQSIATAEGDKILPGLAPKQNPTAGNRRAALPHVANGSTVSTAKNSPDARVTKTATQREPDKVERVIVGIVLFVLAAVPLLTFLFSFGNVGDLGTNLGIDRRIAYLTGPAVDLTATGMIVAATWLSYRGMSEKELWRVHTLSIICALIMFALNCGPAIYAHRYQLAGFSAVGPFLLMAMGFVGPWLLRQLTDTRPAAATGTLRRERAAAEPKAATATAPDAAAPKVATATAANPLPLPPTPAPATASTPAVTTTGNGNAPAPTDGNGRRSPADWAKLALPLWEQYTAKHGEAPTAPVLANLLRNAHPDLPVPGSPRSERNIRAAVEDLLDVDDSDDQAAPAGTSNRPQAVS